jgi:hypothetical protein
MRLFVGVGVDGRVSDCNIMFIRFLRQEQCTTLYYCSEVTIGTRISSVNTNKGLNKFMCIGVVYSGRSWG